MLYLDTDASDLGLGIVLSQDQDGEERVLAYASRTLSAPERVYSVTRKELLAVVFGLKHFRPYLIGRRFVIRTDHAAIQWIRRTPEPMAQAGRWLAIMEEFDFTVQHRAGSRHQNADALSRRPSTVAESIVEEETRPVRDNGDVLVRTVCRPCVASDPDYRPGRHVNIHDERADEEEIAGPKLWHVHSASEIAELQRKDPDIGPVAELRSQYDEQPSFDMIRDRGVNTKIIWSQWPRLVFREGVLYRTDFNRRGQPVALQMVVPSSIRSELMDIVHSGLTGSHLGMGKMMNQLARRVWWPGWRADLRRHYKRCPQCSRYHRGALPRQGLLQPNRVGAVFERLSIDLTGPHPRSRKGNVYILTAVCPFSKWCECIPLRNKEAVTVARALVEQVFCRYGTPLALLSDRGGEVDGHIMREVCKLLQIDKLRTSSYHPACNSACERMHRTLNSLMGKIVSCRQTDWDEHLPYVAAALRASRSDSTGYSANFLMLGREVNTPADIVYGLESPESVTSYDDFVESVREKMSTAYDIVRQNLNVVAERNKRHYDLRAKPRSFSVGQLVYYYNPRKHVGRSEKWQRKYVGPFRVEKVLSPVNVLLRKSNKSKPFVAHIDKVKECYEDPVEKTHAAEQRITQITAHVDTSTEPISVSDDREEFSGRPKRRIEPPRRFVEEC